MKNYYFLTFFLPSLLAFGEVTPQQKQNAAEASVNNLPNAVPATNVSNGGKSSGASVSSDTGAQRPISLKKESVSFYFNYDSRYYYHSNPLLSSGPTKQQASGIWDNVFASTIGLGVFDMGDSVITPYAGGSWTLTDYTESALNGLNRNTTNAFFLLLSNYGGGLSSKLGLNYSNVRYTQTDTEDYMDTNPYISLRYAHFLSQETSGALELTLGTRNTSSDDFFGVTDKVLNRSEAVLSYALKSQLASVTVHPTYSLLYKDYDEGSNDGRKDWMHNLSLLVDYPIDDSFRLYLLGSYASQSSSGTLISDAGNNDYKYWNGGIGLGLTANF